MSDPQPDSIAQGRVVPFPLAPARGAEIEAVYRAQEKRLLRFLRVRLRSEADVQDVAQSAFLRLWQKRDGLHNENLVSLLFITARNIAIDALRQRTRWGKTDAQGDDAETVEAEPPDHGAGPDRILAAKQDVSLILKLIDELPAKCRSAFISYQFHDLGYAEIAQRLEVSESMVRKYLVRAVAHCAARFEELESWE